MRSLKDFKTLKANSILESVIAVTIISICILVAFTIYINVVKQNNSIKYYEAKHKTSKLTEESLYLNDYDSNLYTFEGYTINKEVKIRKTENIALLIWTIKIRDKTYTINNMIPYYEEM